MIIAQTPYRVSFAGGGTDLAAFYEREPGAVLSAAIGHYLYVTVHRRFHETIRLAYSRTEIKACRDDLEHEIAREALRAVELDAPLEITTIGDIPAGTGMGSSSAVTVGLLHALRAYQGQRVDAEYLARGACEIEIDRLKKPIGRQDQYAVSYGGLNVIRFRPGGEVEVRPVAVPLEAVRAWESHCLLLFTGRSRDASSVLTRQQAGTESRRDTLRAMRDLVEPMVAALRCGDLEGFGHRLDEGWSLKRSLGFGISDGALDDFYATARGAGAWGGKVLGAGGGGFVLLMAPPSSHERVRERLGRPQEIPFRLEPRGSRIVFRSEGAREGG